MAKKIDSPTSSEGRNPKWKRHEIILALNLYKTIDGKDEDPSNHKIIELSKTLNSLSDPVERSNNFRNPDSVAMKLQNLRYIDPNRTGGLKKGSKLDMIIFNEFSNSQEHLVAAASVIMAELEVPVVSVPDIDETIEVFEGKRLQKVHFFLERNKKIVDRKKQSVLKRDGKLICEVCDFNFTDVYGKLGVGFIECHHRTALHQLKGREVTNLIDLALVCSNCHRMLHRGGEMSIDTLKAIVKK